MGVTYGLHINCRESEDCIKMLVREISFLDISERIYIGECKVLLLSTLKDRSAFLSVKELSLLIKKLEGIPLLRIMGSCEDDTSVSIFKHYSHLCGRSRSKACLHNIDTACYEGTAHKLLYHIA